MYCSILDYSNKWSTYENIFARATKYIMSVKDQAGFHPVIAGKYTIVHCIFNWTDPDKPNTSNPITTRSYIVYSAEPR